jgi:hypothetical protein
MGEEIAKAKGEEEMTPPNIAQPGEARVDKQTTIRIPYYVRGLALGVPAYLVGVHLWTWVFMGWILMAGACDFREFYAAGYTLRTGHLNELYNYDFQTRLQLSVVKPSIRGILVTIPYTHPPFEAVLFIPLSLLPYQYAYLLYLVFNLACLAVTFRWLKPWTSNLAGIYPLLPAVMFLGFLPAAAVLLTGQDSLVLLTLLTGAAVLMNQNREFTAGLLVGLGVFRFQLILPIALLFLLWRGWRFLVGIALVAAPLVGISLWMVGSPRVYLEMVERVSTGIWAPFGWMPTLRGLIIALSGGKLSANWLQTLVVAASASVLLLVAWAGRRLGRFDQFLLAIVTSTLVSYHLLMYDLSVLLLPLVVMLDRFLATESTGKTGRIVFRLAALVFTVPLLFSYAPLHFYLASIPLFGFTMAVAFCGSLPRSASTGRATRVAEW